MIILKKKNNNMKIYEQHRKVPVEAQKTINGGRLSGKTDINPQWRLRVLTELFGPIGEGWYYEISNREIIPGANDSICCFVHVKLYYMLSSGKWSMPIEGSGGSSFVNKEKNGLYTNDECYKMATTDALSVVCKQLGIGADIYWSKDNTKYEFDNNETIKYTQIENDELKKLNKDKLEEIIENHSKICDLKIESMNLLKKSIYDLNLLELKTLIRYIKSSKQ